MGREEEAKRAQARRRLEEARAQMYQDLILECAERLFSRGSFDRVTMRDIAAEAGISPKTLYAVFPGKDEIYAEVGRRRSRALIDALRESMSAEAPVLERMERGVRALVGFLVEHRVFFRIMMRESRAWGLLPTGDGSGEWRTGYRLQADLVHEGVREGVFYDGDPELMAAIGIATVQVHLAALLEKPGDPEPDEISREIFQQLRRSLCKLPPYALEGSKAG